MAISIYDDEHKLFVTALWNQEISSANIAAALNESYGLNCTRLGIIGLVRRLNLDIRGPSGKFREEGSRKRLATMAERGIKPGPQKKTPVSDPPSAILAPIGIPGEFAQDNCCKWPVNGIAEEYRVCGHPAESRKPYCSGHRAIAVAGAARPSQPGTFRATKQFS